MGFNCYYDKRKPVKDKVEIECADDFVRIWRESGRMWEEIYSAWRMAFGKLPKKENAVTAVLTDLALERYRVNCKIYINSE